MTANTALRRLPTRVEHLLDAAAALHGVPLELARAIAWTESRGDQTRLGTSGERGVMQLMAATAQMLGVDPSELEQNIDGGVRYLASLLKRFGRPGGIAAYNAGPRYGNQPDYRWPASTQQYVRQVQAREQLELDMLKGTRTAVPPLAEAAEQTRPGLPCSPPPPSPHQSFGKGGAKDDT